jgi:hypothetical protein
LERPPTIERWRKAYPEIDKQLISVFYPNEQSHVFEKSWDYLPCLDQHPDFASESQYSQYHIKLFSQAVSAMVDLADFEPKPTAEAEQIDMKISEDAAISRLRPIQDGLDYWHEHRSSSAPSNSLT